MCYFPLDGDMLIQHLIKLDPLRTYRTGLAKQADKANSAAMAARERHFINETQAIAKDSYKQLAGIPTWGYTGKVFKGA
jgi:hypothetical protein